MLPGDCLPVLQVYGAVFDYLEHYPGGLVLLRVEDVRHLVFVRRCHISSAPIDDHVPLAALPQTLPQTPRRLPHEP